MKDLNKLLKITIKRFGIWILIFSLLIAMINGMQTRNRLMGDSELLKSAVYDMSDDLGMEIDNSQKINRDYLNEASKIANAYAQKYELKSDKELDIMTEKEQNVYYQKLESKYGEEIWTKESNYKTFESMKTANEDGSMGAGAYLEDSTKGILILVAIISMLITSLEQSLPYYEFTMMFPWKKKDEVWMKAIIVFIIGLLIFLINLLSNIMMINASDFGSLLNVASLGDSIFKSILMVLSTSIITVATGMIAGNFVGQIGLLIIAAGSIDLVKTILDSFIGVFSSNLVDVIDKGYMNFKNNLPNIIKPFINLLNVDFTYSSIIGLILVAFVWAMLAYFVNSKQNSENSGYLVLSKPVANVAKVLGILTLTSILNMLGSATFSGVKNIIFSIVIYAISLLISIKLFDILFKVRLKF